MVHDPRGPKPRLGQHHPYGPGPERRGHLDPVLDAHAWLAAALAVCLVAMVVTGLVLAFRSAKPKAAGWAVTAGLVIPLAFVLYAYYHR